MKSCEICELLTTHNHGEDVQVVQTNNWRVVLDPNQRFLGKAFVTLLEHKQALSDLTSEDWIDFGALIRRLEIALRRTFRPSHFNWSCLMNIAASKGQPTHVHWHFHPRYDTTLVVAGESFTDANSYPLGGGDHVVSKEVLQTIATKIQKHWPSQVGLDSSGSAQAASSDQIAQ